MRDITKAREQYALWWDRSPVPVPTACTVFISALEVEITRLTAEISALRATAENLDKMDGMDGAACAVIRQKLDEFGAPRAAFIDDHVANGIVHAKRLARAEALEDAAKVAESHSDDKPSQCNTDWNDGYDDGCEGAAAAIRALMVKP